MRNLPPRATVGTGSQRRARATAARPAGPGDEGRARERRNPLCKLHAGDYDALVLAEAGLTRLGLGDEITELLQKSLILPAIGQGALGLECRADDVRVLTAIAPLDHADTHHAVLAERSMLRTLSGGCLAPVAAWGRVEADRQLHLSAAVLSIDGRQRLFAESAGPPETAEELGKHVAAELTVQGAAELIDAARAN